MSRCACCDAVLEDWELTRKSNTTKQYLDMCDTCFGEVSDVFIDLEESQEQQEIGDLPHDSSYI